MKCISLILFSLITCSVTAQVDSFSVNEYNFKFVVPDGWTLFSKDDGICEYAETNVKIDMPLKCKKCFGSLMISISEITDAEKKKRSIENDEDDPLKIDEGLFEKKFGSYLTGCGYYDAKPDDDTVIYTNVRGDFLVGKPKKNEKKLVQVHQYARWCYFPVNDSLEILIYFRGLIPHDQETDADAAVNNTAQKFFQLNRAALDSMLLHTNPLVFQMDTFPLDSIDCFKTFLKYPVFSDWQYDTTKSNDGTRSVLLYLKPPTPDSCDDASIVVTSKVLPYDPKVEISVKQILIATAIYGDNKVDDYLDKATDTSGFAKRTQHYYFDRQSDLEPSTDCPELTRYSEKTFIYIHTRPDERILILISFTSTSGEEERRKEYFEAYNYFVYYFVTLNDFEKIYLLNKP